MQRMEKRRDALKQDEDALAAFQKWADEEQDDGPARVYPTEDPVVTATNREKMAYVRSRKRDRGRRRHARAPTKAEAKKYGWIVGG